MFTWIPTKRPINRVDFRHRVGSAYREVGFVAKKTQTGARGRFRVASLVFYPAKLLVLATKWLFVKTGMVPKIEVDLLTTSFVTLIEYVDV
jgi:hypothetical protein